MKKVLIAFVGVLLLGACVKEEAFTEVSYEKTVRMFVNPDTPFVNLDAHSEYFRFAFDSALRANDFDSTKDVVYLSELDQVSIDFDLPENAQVENPYIFHKFRLFFESGQLSNYIADYQFTGYNADGYENMLLQPIHMLPYLEASDSTGLSNPVRIYAASEAYQSTNQRIYFDVYMRFKAFFAGNENIR